MFLQTQPTQIFTVFGSLSIDTLTDRKRENFLRCPDCASWIDCRNLGSVCDHIGPLPHPVQSAIAYSRLAA